MKYKAIDVSRSYCRLELSPETEVDLKSIEGAKNNPEEYQDTFLFHYDKALKSFLDKDAVFLKLVEDSSFPTPVTVSYQIVRGMGQ